MSSSLRQQLQQQIGDNNALASKLLRKDQPSIMFEAREASDMDISTVYALGLNGLRSLVAIDQRFASYQESLFSQTARHYDRAFKTAEENVQLDKEIDSFLVCLQPYVLLKASVKCLEWLVRRFYIQDFNVDSLLCCLLPYTDNKLFARVVGVCKLDGTHWAFLSAADSASFGQRDFWARRFAKDASLVTLICRMVSELQKYLSFSALVKIRVALYVSMVLPYLQAVHVDENVMLRVLPSIVDCLKSNVVEEMQTAAYIIISQFCDSVVLSETLCGVFSKTILVTARNFEKAMLCFLKLYQSQENIKHIPKETIRSCISQDEVFCKALANMHAKYDCNRFFKIFCHSMLDVVTEEDLPFIQNLMAVNAFEDDIAALVCQKIVSFDIPSDSTFNQCANHILQKLNFIPEADNISAMNADDHGTVIDTSLFLHLNSPKVEHRLKGIKIVIDKAVNLKAGHEDMQSFCGIFLGALRDDYDEVVMSVLQCEKFDLVTMGDPDNLMEALIFALRNERSNDVVVMTLWAKLCPLITNPFEMNVFATLAQYALQSNLSELIANEIITHVLKADPATTTLIEVLSSGNRKAIKALLESDDSNVIMMALLLLIKTLSSAPKKEIIEELPSLIRMLSVKLSNKDSSFSCRNIELIGCYANGFSAYCIREIGVILAKCFSDSIEWLVSCATKIQMKSFDTCLAYFQLMCQNLPMVRNELQYWLSTQFHSKHSLLRFLAMIWIRTPDSSIALLALGLANNVIDETLIDSVDDVMLCLLVTLGSASRDCRELTVPLLEKMKLQPRNPLIGLQSAIFQNKELICQDPAFAASYIVKNFELSKGSIASIAKIFQSHRDPILHLNLLKLFGHDEKMMKNVVISAADLSHRANTSILEDEEFACLLEFFDKMETSSTPFTAKHASIYRNIFECTVQDNLQLTRFLKKFLSKLTASFFVKISDFDMNCMFLKSLIDMSSRYPSLTAVVKIAIMNMNFSVDLLLSEVEDIRSELDQVSSESLGMNSIKKAKSDISDEPNAIIFHKMELFLEVIKVKKDKVDGVVVLVPYLFELLTLLYSEHAQSDDVSLNYVMQLLLVTILEYVRMSDFKQTTQWDDSLIRLDVLVQLIRSTSNPETRNSSIALISTLGKIYPEKVLRNIMPVFTFMGASMLQRDDLSSFNLTEQLIKATVPIIVEHRSDAEFSPLLFNVLIVFANAFFHVPEHRRLHFYIVLTKALGVTKYLGLITLMILSRISRSFSVADKRLLLDFLTVFLTKFTLEQRMKSMKFISEKTSELIGLVAQDSSSKSESYRIFDVADVAGMKLFCSQIVDFIENCVSKQAFLDTTGENVQEERMEIQGFVEALMEVSSTVLSSGVENAEVLSENVRKCVKKLLLSVSLSTLISVLKYLLTNSGSDVREISINVLKDRLASVSEVDDDSDILALQGSFLDILCSNKESRRTKECTISVLQMLSDRLKAESQQRLLDLFGDAVQACQNDEILKAPIMHLFSTLVSNNGVRTLPYLKEGIRLVMSVGDNARQQTAAIDCIKTLLEKIPKFLSPHMADILKFVSVGHGNAGMIERLVAEKIDCRTLLPVIYKTFKECNVDQKVSVINLLQHSIKNMQREDVMNYYKSIFKFMLTCLDSAASHKGDGGEYETKIIECLAELILKLNEMLFKPLFLKVIDWALSSIDVSGKQIDASVSTKRKLILYRFTNYLLAQLKSIFATYYVNMVDTSVQLVADASCDTQLWREVVDSLSKFFMYDNDFQISGEKNDKIIENTGSMLGMMSKFDMQTGGTVAKQSVIPCICNYATMLVTSKQHAYIKNLNHKILMSTRHESAKVKLAALWTLQELYENMGDELLTHLPETVPFLAELLEDDDEIVEMTCRKVIKLVESYLGEALELK